MKKALAAALALVLLLAAAACAQIPSNTNSTDTTTANNTTVTENAPEPAKAVTFAAAELYDGYGIGSEQCAESGRYHFRAENSDGVEWTVYVLTEEFTDSLRYLPQAYEPALTGEGDLDLNAGEYVYVQCSANGFTGVEAPEGCSYSFSLAE